MSNESEFLQPVDKVKEAALERVLQVKAKIKEGVGTNHPISFDYDPRQDGSQSSQEFYAHLPKVKFEGQFPVADEPIVKLAVEQIMLFLAAPLVEDGFENDDKGRDAWIQSVIDLYGEEGKRVVEDNRYRPNMIFFPYSYIDLLADTFPDLKKLHTAVSPLPALQENEYKNLSRRDKKQLLAQLTQVAVDFLEYLAGYPQSLTESQVAQKVATLESMTFDVDMGIAYKIINDLEEKVFYFEKKYQDHIQSKWPLKVEDMMQLGLGLSRANESLFNLKKFIVFLKRLSVRAEAVGLDKHTELLNLLMHLKFNLQKLRTAYLDAGDVIKRFRKPRKARKGGLTRYGEMVNILKTRFAPEEFGNLDESFEDLIA